MIYFDYCATTPMSDRAIDVMVKAAKEFYGNPNSLHDIGGKAKNLLEHSRSVIATCINGDPKGVYFTGGGSDSNNLAIKSLVKGKQGHIITTSIEHFSVTNTFLQLEEEGFEVTFLDVEKDGKVSVATLEKELKTNTILVSIGHANSDIGTIQDLATIGAFLKEKGILFHSDCVQSFGKIPLDVEKLNVDSVSLSSHKIYGPKGVGAVYIAPEISWKSIIPNTVHESGFRAGTINVPANAAFAEAANEICTNRELEQNRLKNLAEHLLQRLEEKNISFDLIGHDTDRLSHHLALCIKGLEGQYLMLELNKLNIAISTGTACKVGEQNASKTMLQLGYSSAEATELIRLSMGKQTTKEHIEKFVEALEEILIQFQS